ncbi:MAG: NAD(P)H-hydrate dehydratase [Candidatus Cloacimonetes bacterium]|nr:NAD(P)H-hydrate dehydratase [Candidatus Cloacimonadota bacterium]
MVVLSREEMYRCDAMTIAETGISGSELMENAGRNSAAYIRVNILPAPGKVLVFCGAGNNGGDGFVIARYLTEWGYEVSTVLTGKEEKMTPETCSNYQQCQAMDCRNYLIGDWETWQRSGIVINSFDLVVDALLGVGFRGELRGWSARLTQAINSESRLTVAIDIASGTDADSGEAANSIKAAYTLTMAACKYGSLLGEGLTCSGKIVVIDIGMPAEIIKTVAPKGRLLDKDSVEFPIRRKHYHKGNYGRVAIIAGSPGFSGAGIMAARAALRAGAGLITLFHPKGMELIFETQLLEVMTRSLPDDLEILWEQLETFDVILIGPGTGTGRKITEILQMLLKRWHKPLVIDADALNILSIHHEWLPYLKDQEILLTPHLGEFARLSDYTIPLIMADPVKILEKFCAENGLQILLKSSTTIFSDGSQNVLEISGNDGLATGGSGDVLAGITVSFAGQGLPLVQAGLSASWLMGRTAEKLAEQRATASIIPSDIIENIFKF